MKISKTSLHYRFNNFIQGGDFRMRAIEGRFTTCSYIRTCIASVFGGIFKLVILIALLVAVLTFLACMFGVPIAIFMGYVPADKAIPPCVVGWAAVAFGLFVLMCKQTNQCIKNARARAMKNYVSPEPNVFIQAIVDKHNKFCTRVEVA